MAWPKGALQDPPVAWISYLALLIPPLLSELRLQWSPLSFSFSQFISQLSSFYLLCLPCEQLPPPPPPPRSLPATLILSFRLQLRHQPLASLSLIPVLKPHTSHSPCLLFVLFSVELITICYLPVSLHSFTSALSAPRGYKIHEHQIIIFVVLCSISSA